MCEPGAYAACIGCIVCHRDAPIRYIVCCVCAWAHTTHWPHALFGMQICMMQQRTNKLVPIMRERVWGFIFNNNNGRKSEHPNPKRHTIESISVERDAHTHAERCIGEEGENRRESERELAIGKYIAGINFKLLKKYDCPLSFDAGPFGAVVMRSH